jgi:hypothetical protein
MSSIWVLSWAVVSPNYYVSYIFCQFSGFKSYLSFSSVMI